MFDKLRSLCISVDNSPAVYINQQQIELVSKPQSYHFHTIANQVTPVP
jgi:hypothetical protein